MNGSNEGAETRRPTVVMGSGSGLPVSMEVPSPSLSEVVERSQQLLGRVRELRALNGRLAAHNAALKTTTAKLEAAKRELDGRVASLEMELGTTRQAAEKAEERVRQAQLDADARVAEVQRTTGETIAEAVNAVQADAAEKVAKITREASDMIRQWQEAYAALQKELETILSSGETDDGGQS